MVYDELALTLATILKRLREAGGDARPLERTEIDAIKAHQKAVLMVIDFEAQLLKRRIDARHARDERIDLAAARTEIARRLAGLEAAQRA